MSDNPVRQKMRELERDLAERRRCSGGESIDLQALETPGIGRELRGLRGIGELIAGEGEVISGEMREDLGLAVYALAAAAWEKLEALPLLMPYRHAEAEE